MARKKPDTIDNLRNVFMGHLYREVARMSRVMNVFYGACVAWVVTMGLTVAYSREIATFIVEHF